MLLEHGCLDLMCQPQKLLTFWTSEPQVAYKMVAYIKKSVLSSGGTKGADERWVTEPVVQILSSR